MTPEKKTPNTLRRFVLASVVASSLIIGVSSMTGCPQAQTAQNILTPAEACIVNALFINGGLQDPSIILTQCAGVTIADVIQVIETLLANQPDASVVTLDGGAGGPMKVSRAELEAALAKSKALQAAQEH